MVFLLTSGTGTCGAIRYINRKLVAPEDSALLLTDFQQNFFFLFIKKVSKYLLLGLAFLKDLSGKFYLKTFNLL